MSRIVAAAIFSSFITAFAFAQTQPDISVAKTGPAVAPQGTDIAYDVTIRNIGGTAASGVSLSDVIPAGLTFVSASQLSGPGFSCVTPPVGSPGTVTCTIATLSAGATAAFQFKFHIPLAMPVGTITNTATGASTPPDANPGNDASSAQTDVIAASADIAVTKSGPATAAAGSNVSYDITISNYGPADASTVTLIDNIPAGMTFVSATQNSGPAFNCSTPNPGDPGQVNCTLALFPVGQSATFTFVFNISVDTAPGTSFTNVATGNALQDDANEENDSGTAVTTTPPPPTADMGIQKSGPSGAGPNTMLTFTITVTNSGPDAATNAAWSDVLPGNLEFQSVTQQSGPAMPCSTPAVGANGTVTCTAATFPAFGTATFTLVVHVPPGTSGSSYTNTATVTRTEVDPNPENNSSAITVTISAVDLSIVKSGPATANAGTGISYTIAVANAGPDTAVNIFFNDSAPAGTAFVSVTQLTGPAATCSNSPAFISCSLGMLVSTATATFDVVLNTGSATTINNTATITSDSFDTNTTNDSSTATTTVTQSADLSVVKSGPATAIAGTNATYTITVTNNGPSNAANVTLSDPAPAGATLVSFTQTAGPAFNCAGASCTIALLSPGATATFTYVLNVSPGTTGSVINAATASSSTADPNGTNNSSSVTTFISQSANLGVTKSGPTSATAGMTITFTVTATNAGPSNASTVTVSDPAPANTSFVSVSQTSGPAFACTGTNCTIGSFAAGASATFQYVFSVNAAATGSIDNTATITSPTSDPTPGNNSANAAAGIITSADLAVTKSGPASVTAGTNVTYTVTAVNNGPSNAVNVTLTDNPPTNTTFVSVTQTSGPAFTCTGSTCTIANFAAGASATFDFVFAVDPNATGVISNAATISSATPDPVPGNNSANASTTGTQTADLSISKSGPAAVTAGSNVTYTVTASNAGPSAAANVTVSDPAPANTTFVSVTQTSGPAFTCTGSNCTIASFAAGATATFSYVFNVNPAATGTVNNTATITSSTPDPTPANSVGAASAAIDPGPTDVSITKTASPGRVPFGGTVTYTLVVTNNGPGTAAGVVVTDVLPAALTFQSASTTQGTCSGTTTVTCNVGALAPAGTATITITARAPQTAGPIANTATVTSANAETVPANNSATTSFDVVVDIPTLSPLALAGLALMIAGLAIVIMRR